MKILRIIYDWPKPWQGLAPHPYEITSTQCRMGHEVELFCGWWPKAGGIERPHDIKVNPIYREPFKGTLCFTSSVLLFFKYLSWRKKNTPDIIHSHGHFAIWIYFYRSFLQRFFPWSKELKIPLVAHFHNIALSRMIAMKEQKKTVSPESEYVAWPLEIYANKLAIKVAAACIFVSAENRDDAIKYYDADPRRCFVVETGVNTEIFVPASPVDKEKSRQVLDLDIYDKVVLNHGVMSERKNVLLLIEAISLLPSNYKLLLVGPSDPTYLQRMNETIRNFHIEDRIIKVGYTPYPEVPIAYQVSDVFVLPSGWEGLPKAVMQGLACNIPCIVSGFKLSESIQGLYYLENLEAKTIAEKIFQVVENPVPVDVAKISSYYSWNVRGREIEKVYEFAKKNYLV